MKGMSVYLVFALLVHIQGIMASGCDPKAVKGTFNGFAIVGIQDAMACFQSIPLLPDNALQMINSIRETIKMSYVFTDIAIDPSKSKPANNPRNLGIYDSLLTGKVDLVGELDALEEDVKQNGASVALKFVLQTIFNRARDRHTTLFGEGMFGGLADSRFVFAQTDQNTNAIINTNGNITIQSNSDSAGNLQVFYDISPGVSKAIASIDKKDPIEYLQSLADDFSLGLNLHSGGVRFQNLYNMFQSSNSAPFVLWIGDDLGLPTVKDNVLVQFVDGSSMQWSSFLLVEPTLFKSSIATLTKIANTIPQDGPYQSFEKAVVQAYEPTSVSDKPRVPTKPKKLKALTPESTMVGDLEFTTFSYNPDGKGDQIFAGFTAMEDYMVLKVSTFDRVPPDSIIGAWNAMVQKAQQVGAKKLMIDIIANGGGNIASGYALVQCMYPDITFADLQNPYDAPNGVQISFLQQAIAPVMQAVGSLVVDASPEVNQGLFAGAVYMNKKPAQLIEALQGTVNAMKGVFLLVNQTDPSAAGTIAAAISLTATVKREVQARKKITSGQLRGVLSSISSIYLDQYPGADPYSGTYLAGKPRITRTLDRGGVKSNYTQIFTMINPNDVESYRPKIRPGSFSSYIILGNGEGGSTSNTFETTARFYAKKYNKTVSPSVGVSFGCNGDAKDCAVTQYAGGNVAGTDMTPYYSVAGTSLMVSRIFQILPLEVLDQLSQDYEADFGSFVDDTNAFIEMLPQPPVLATSLSSFTKREIYQNTFGPGTLPLEYFQIPPDGYIQQWYTDSSTAFTPSGGSSSLPQVYGAASAFFA